MNLHLKKMHFNFKFNFADMEVVLQSKLIRKHKSDFLFDLILHPTDQIYLRIKQNIIDDNKKYELKINPMVLNDLIVILQSFQKDYNFSQKKAPPPWFVSSRTIAFLTKILAISNTTILY